MKKNQPFDHHLLFQLWYHVLRLAQEQNETKEKGKHEREQEKDSFSDDF